MQTRLASTFDEPRPRLPHLRRSPHPGRANRSQSCHIFTVPFHQTRFLDDVFALPGDGEPILLQPPIYHDDPLRAEGILVYTMFFIEMLVKLQHLGFRTHMYRLYHPSLGILGINGFVFEAIREK